jgi:hypothetical protein
MEVVLGREGGRVFKECDDIFGGQGVEEKNGGELMNRGVKEGGVSRWLGYT